MNGKPSRPVLRGLGASNGARLLDSNGAVGFTGLLPHSPSPARNDSQAPEHSPCRLLLRSLIRELAEYERESQEVLITEEQLRRDDFGPCPIFRAVVAEQDGQPAGFAVFFTSLTT